MDFFCLGNNMNISGFILIDFIFNIMEYMMYEGLLMIFGC